MTPAVLARKLLTLQALCGAACEGVEWLPTDCLAELSVRVECPLESHLMQVEEAWGLAQRLSLAPACGVGNVAAVPTTVAGLLSQASCTIDPIAAGPWAFVANAYRAAIMVSTGQAASEEETGLVDAHEA